MMNKDKEIEEIIEESKDVEITIKANENKRKEDKVESTPEEKKYKRKNRLLLLLLLLLLCGMGWYIYQNNQEKEGLPRQRNAEMGYLPGMSEAEIQAEMEKKVAESELAISINSQLNFPSGNEQGFIRIENNANNHYLLMVEMYRNDNNEMIYQSGAIEPGFYLEKDKLLINLKKGVYPVTVKFKAYHVATEAFIGEAQANSEVIIEN